MFNIERNNITIISTGGTIEKVYDEKEGKLENQQSVLEEMFAKLRLPELKFNHIPLMSKDSLSFHGRLFTLPDIKKDRDSGHFVVC